MLGYQVKMKVSRDNHFEVFDAVAILKPIEHPKASFSVSCLSVVALYVFLERLEVFSDHDDLLINFLIVERLIVTLTLRSLILIRWLKILESCILVRTIWVNR